MAMLEALHNPVILCLAVGLFGLFTGSFLNVVIYRLPIMMKRIWSMECLDFFREEYQLDLKDKCQLPPAINLCLPASRCQSCQTPIKFYDNIPVISYLLLGGKCRACKVKISPRYALIELLTAMVFMVLAYHYGLQLSLVFALILSFALIAISFIDFDHQLIPDDISLPLIWLGLIVNSFGVFTNLSSALIGAVAGYMVLWTLFQIFKLFTGKEGMGYGDFKLLAALGAWLGWQFLPFIILLSSFLGAVVGISMMVFKNHDRATPIPFGPYIAVSGWIALLWGDMIIAKYFQLMGL